MITIILLFPSTPVLISLWTVLCCIVLCCYQTAKACTRNVYLVPSIVLRRRSRRFHGMIDVSIQRLTIQSCLLWIRSDSLTGNGFVDRAIGTNEDFLLKSHSNEIISNPDEIKKTIECLIWLSCVHRPILFSGACRTNDLQVKHPQNPALHILRFLHCYY